MKNLLIAATLLLSSVAFGSLHYADKQEARALLSGMGAEEALESGMFDVKVSSPYFGEISSTASPADLCLTDTTLQSMPGVTYSRCNKWSSNGTNNRGQKETKTFNVRSHAVDYGRHVTCAGYGAPQVVSVARNGQKWACVKWSAVNKDGDKIVTDNRWTAKRIDEDYKCAPDGMALVPSYAPTGYKVSFYMESSSNRFSRKKFITDKTFPFQACTGGTIPPQEAN